MYKVLRKYFKRLKKLSKPTMFEKMIVIENVVILTARSNPTPVNLFLKNNKIPPINIVAVGTSDPRAKAMYILDRVKKRDHDQVVVFEDNVKNIRTRGKKQTNGLGIYRKL